MDILDVKEKSLHNQHIIKVLEVWEDKKPELPQILGYNGIDKGSYIKYGCAEIPKSWFTDTRNRVPIEIKFDSNKILNKKQIEAIIEYCAVNK